MKMELRVADLSAGRRGYGAFWSNNNIIKI